MSGANGTAVHLRDVDTSALQRELKDRGRGVDCHTEHSTGWIPAGLNRVRCKDCHEKQQGGRS